MARRQLHHICFVLIVTVALVSSVLTTSSQPAEAQSVACSTSFSDVPEGLYYSDAVTWAACTGITTGTSATTFSPDAPVTRAQMATFLWRFAGKPAVGSHDFVDVPAGSYYDKPVAWMLYSGITTGTSATMFSPTLTVTRAQAATFLWRQANEPTATTPSPFTDVPAAQYYTTPVAWMYANDITTGTTATTFSPGATLTRADMVTFLWRMRHDRTRALAAEQVLDAFSSLHQSSGSFALEQSIGIDHGQGWFQYTNDTSYSTSIADSLVSDGHLTPDFLTDPLDTNKDHYLRVGHDFLIFRCDADEPGDHVGVFLKTDAIEPSTEALAFWADNDCNDYALTNGFNYFRVLSIGDGGPSWFKSWTEIDSDGNTIHYASGGGGVGFSRRI